MRRPRRAARLAPLAFALAGCASYTQVALQVREPLVRGDLAAAESFLLDKKPGGDGLPYLMELGLVRRYREEFAASNEAFDAAEQLVEELWTRSLSKEALAFLTSDETIPYDGEMWERVLIHYYRALNYLDLGEYDGALVECRKINHRLKVYSDAEDDPPAYSQDAFAQYLTALMYEAGGELNDAWVSLRLADSAYARYEEAYGTRTPESLKRDLLRLSRQLGLRDDEERLRKRWPDVQAPSTEELLERGEVVLFWEEGFAPAKLQEELFVPILKRDEREDRIAFARTLSGRVIARPVYDDVELEYLLRIAVPAYPPLAPSDRPERRAELSAAGVSARSELVQDLECIARRGLEDRAGKIFLRSILRALAKYGVTRGVTDKKGEVAGTLVNLLTAAAEKADTRAWITLPRSIHLIRLVVAPGTHDLTLVCRGSEDAEIETVTFEDVAVGAGEVRFLSHRTY